MPNVTVYVMTTWQNLPNKTSAISALNLNHIEQGIKNVTDFINTLNAESGIYLCGAPFTQALLTKLNGIEDQANKYVLPIAGTGTLGGVKVDGSTITINENGVITAVFPTYSISSLSDVQITSIQDGQILKWDSANSKWINSSEAEVRTQLSLLEDVNISNPQDGETLRYNSTTEKWENSEGGGSGDVLDYEDTMQALGVPEPIITTQKGSYIKTVLWYNNGNPADTGTDINYLDNISKYDQLLIIHSTIGDGGPTTYENQSYVDVEDLLETGPFMWSGYFRRWLQVNSTTTTFNYTSEASGEDNRAPRIYKIYGIKYLNNTTGDSKSSSGYKKNLLWGCGANNSFVHPPATPASITLLHDIKDYDDIEVICGFTATGVGIKVDFRVTAEFLDNDPTGQGYLFTVNPHASQFIRMFKGSADNIVNVTYDSAGYGIYQIYGIKY